MFVVCERVKRERERGREIVCVCACVCLQARVCACVCVWHRWAAEDDRVCGHASHRGGNTRSSSCVSVPCFARLRHQPPPSCRLVFQKLFLAFRFSIRLSKHKSLSCDHFGRLDSKIKRKKRKKPILLTFVILFLCNKVSYFKIVCGSKKRGVASACWWFLTRRQLGENHLRLSMFRVFLEETVLCDTTTLVFHITSSSCSSLSGAAAALNVEQMCPILLKLIQIEREKKKKSNFL